MVKWSNMIIKSQQIFKYNKADILSSYGIADPTVFFRCVSSIPCFYIDIKIKKTHISTGLKSEGFSGSRVIFHIRKTVTQRKKYATPDLFQRYFIPPKHKLFKHHFHLFTMIYLTNKIPALWDLIT